MNKNIDEATLMALIDAGVVREVIITRIRHQGDHINLLGCHPLPHSQIDT